MYTFILSYIVYFVIYYFVLFRYKCQCSNGARCHQTSGKCSCTPGWRGIFCDTPCPAGRWGAECKEECTCKNGGSCHHITGAYCEFYILKERLQIERKIVSMFLESMTITHYYELREDVIMQAREEVNMISKISHYRHSFIVFLS